MDGNKLVQVWNTARNSYLSPFKSVVNSTLEMFFDVRYKNHISYDVRFNVTHIDDSLTMF